MNAIVIRFPYTARLVEPKPATGLTDSEWEAKFAAGVRRRIAAKVRDLPVPSFLLKRQAG